MENSRTGFAMGDLTPAGPGGPIPAMTLLVSLLLACATPPPSPTAVEPSKGEAGTSVTVTGQHFGPGTTARLGAWPLGDAARIDEQTLRGTVPLDAAPGPLVLVVTDSRGRSATLPAAFTVTAPRATLDDPCDPEIKLFAHIPPTADFVRLDLHPPSGAVEQEQIPVREIASVEYEARRQGERLCSSIWLRTRRGARHLFDSDAKVPLRQQAQRIANGLGKKLEVVADEVAQEPETP